MERTTLSARSRRLFTLSALYTATGALLSGREKLVPQERANLALRYWGLVFEQFAEWGEVRDGKLSAGEVRQDFIHSHGVVLHALGRVGNAVFDEFQDNWDAKLQNLKNINWRRSHQSLWEGRAMVGGKVSQRGLNKYEALQTKGFVKVQCSMSKSTGPWGQAIA